MRWKVALFSLFLAGQALLAGEDASDATKVSVVKPCRRDVTRWLKLPATVEPDAEVTLYAQVSGFLKDLSVDIGDVVKPGQVIGRLYAPDLEQDVKLAETQLGAAEADYQKAVVDLEREEEMGKEIEAEELIAQADLAKNKAELAGITDKYSRTEKLFAKEAATELDYVNQKYACLGAGAAVTSSEKKLEKYKTDRELWRKEVAVSQAMVAIAKSKVAMAQTALARAKTFFSFTALRIPDVGYCPGCPAFVTRRYVASGDLIRGGAGATSGVQPLVTLQVTDPVRVVADIPEADSIGVEKGTEARLFFSDFKEQTAPQKVSRTSHALAANARTLRVEIDLPNAQQKFKPGMMAIVEFSAEVHKNVLAVPLACLATDRSDNSVFIVQGGRVKKVSVEVGLRSNNWCEITKPELPEDSLLVKNITGNLTDGAAVQVAQ